MEETTEHTGFGMTLEELWELFPIELVAHKECWGAQYEGMKAQLESLLEGFADLRIHHIGSTAVEGIAAKDIVDILVELPASTRLEAAARMLEQHGFLRMSTSDARISLNYGYTPTGFAEKVFHIHLRYQGDADEVLFRDYLNAHPEVAATYQELKLALCAQRRNDRDAYTEGKTAFVHKWTARALTEAQRKAPDKHL